MDVKWNLRNFRPTSRSVPGTQNFDPISFDRVNDHYGSCEQVRKIAPFFDSALLDGLSGFCRGTK
jgi:hypothetical protein